VLFSDARIADYINAYFEPVWESVRPVPIVKIDFGNGTEVTRTLHGNISTYVCNSDGVVIDVLPGLYEPSAYMTHLDELRSETKNISSATDLTKALHDYHLAQLNSMPLRVMPPIRDMRKGVVEMPLKKVITQNISSAPDVVPLALKPEYPGIDMRSSALNQLIVDTISNEASRRRAIHSRLASSGPIQPKDLTKWLYKNVLHADLDDPYLGLGPTLFSTYPFKDDPKS